MWAEHGDALGLVLVFTERERRQRWLQWMQAITQLCIFLGEEGGRAYLSRATRRAPRGVLLRRRGRWQARQYRGLAATRSRCVMEAGIGRRARIEVTRAGGCGQAHLLPCRSRT